MRRAVSGFAGCLIGAAIAVSAHGQDIHKDTQRAGVVNDSGGPDIPKDSRLAGVVRGSIVFATYCVLCHDARGTGNGRAAKLYQPRPANLTKSPFPDEYKEIIIRKGGAAVGRSEFMPPWGNQLTDEQIKDLVVYLRTIVVKS